jgi:hypothetical protein
MRFPAQLSILIAATIGACAQSLTPEMPGTGGRGAGGTGTGESGTGGSGSCGTICGGGSTCIKGSCGCSVVGQQLCGGSCIDVTSDNSNCGSCGHACASDQLCSNGSCATMVLGCQMSDPPATSEIATFSSAAGIAPSFTLFTYGAPPQPIYTIAAGMVNVTDTIEIGPTNQYQGFGIYLNGNAPGTDCVDASSYTGVSFSLSGSLMGTGCTMQFSISDSEHDQIIPGSFDPKAAGPVGSYPPQLSITSAELAATPVTIQVPFAGTNAPTGGSPLIPIDTSKLVELLWEMSAPVASDGGAAECVWNINVSNVRFY